MQCTFKITKGKNKNLYCFQVRDLCTYVDHKDKQEKVVIKHPLLELENSNILRDYFYQSFNGLIDPTEMKYVNPMERNHKFELIDDNSIQIYEKAKEWLNGVKNNKNIPLCFIRKIFGKDQTIYPLKCINSRDKNYQYLLNGKWIDDPNMNYIKSKFKYLVYNTFHEIAFLEIQQKYENLSCLSEYSYDYMAVNNPLFAFVCSNQEKLSCNLLDKIEKQLDNLFNNNKLNV